MEILDLINSGSIQLKKNGINTHRLDSEILLAKILKRQREELLINLDQRASLQTIKGFKKLIDRRSFKEPIAYILKEKEFWSKMFFVDKNTLIPRPETELMVEKIVSIFKNKDIKILDIGTGTGCILISILSELNKSRGVGIDISQKAIKIAIKNLIKHKLTDQAKFYKRSFTEFYGSKFDLIVSNPP